ncbi:MAG: hypothetical protein IH994_08055 [Proteobacteria bacterium]|nr:hypothetical protein [Pseudomonadota bacterium]
MTISSRPLSSSTAQATSVHTWLRTQAVAVTGGRVPLEASGGITLETIAAIAATGVDFISVGAITQSAPAVDIGLDPASG